MTTAPPARQKRDFDLGWEKIYHLFAGGAFSRGHCEERLRPMTSLSDMHVLMVDDSRQMRFLIRSLLGASGLYHMSEAQNGAEALDIMRKSPVDLVILDWKMEPINGLELARTLRWSAQSPNPYVPILMLSAHTEASRVAAARDAGVSGFVKKPISAGLLFERVSFALTDSRMFVRSGDFFGPDRRKGQTPGYAGPLRRKSDSDEEELFDLEDVRYRA